MMDDHHFFELVAGEGEIRELFWRTALETFRVDLTLKVCPAENFLCFNFNVYVYVKYVACLWIDQSDGSIVVAIF